MTPKRDRNYKTSETDEVPRRKLQTILKCTIPVPPPPRSTARRVVRDVGLFDADVAEPNLGLFDILVVLLWLVAREVVGTDGGPSEENKLQPVLGTHGHLIVVLSHLLSNLFSHIRDLSNP